MSAAVQVELFQRRVAIRTARQNRATGLWRNFTARGVVLLDMGSQLLVRFDGRWRVGSCEGCTLLVTPGQCL